MANKLPRDLLVFFALIALPVAAFLLSGTSDTQFYVSLFTVSLLGIFGFQFYYSEEIGRFLPFNEELDAFGFVLVLMGVVGCLFISSFIINTFTSQTLAGIVPVPKAALAVGSITLPPFASAILFNLTLVAPAEECSKLVTTFGLYAWLKDLIGKSGAEVLGVGVPIGVWATLHSFVALAGITGSDLIVYIFSIFASGILIFYVMRKTKSLLAAILVHAFYNILVYMMLNGKL